MTPLAGNSNTLVVNSNKEYKQITMTTKLVNLLSKKNKKTNQEQI
jgi:hypothetical protein